MDRTGFELLGLELAQWHRMEKPARLFLRDDDAIEVTDQLMRLKCLIEEHNIPMLMAVIPKLAKPELAEQVLANPLISVAVHGISHENYAPPEKKKCELGLHQAVEITVGELGHAREKLAGSYGDSLTSILVPPWNRIADEVACRAGEVGFTAISGFTWKHPDTPLPWVNTHVDIIDWKNGKRGKEADILAHELAENLKIARAKNFAQIGILTHHLVHDAIAWDALETLFDYLSSHDYITWLTPDQLLQNQP